MVRAPVQIRIPLRTAPALFLDLEVGRRVPNLHVDGVAVVTRAHPLYAVPGFT